jgi:hypothetical protein
MFGFEFDFVTISDFAWLFWTPVAFLFAESWARAWASRRAAENRPPAEGVCCPDAGA